MRKYELIDPYPSDDLYTDSNISRIRALKDFSDVKAGDIGGFVSSEKNLSHYNDCWIYDDARCINDARMEEGAKARDRSFISGSALITGRAHISGRARITGEATVSDMANVEDNAYLSGSAYIHGNARVYHAGQVYEDGEVGEFASVAGDCAVIGNGKVFAQCLLRYGRVTRDLEKDLFQLIAASLNIYPIRGKYILYKVVQKIAENVYRSCFRPDFIYEIGKEAKCLDFDKRWDRVEVAGIHLSTPDHYPVCLRFTKVCPDVLIACQVDVDDIISCQRGMVRAKKVLPIAEISSYVPNPHLAYKSQPWNPYIRTKTDRIEEAPRQKPQT